MQQDELVSDDNEGFSDHTNKASKLVTRVERGLPFPEDLLKSYLICLERIKNRPAGVWL